MRKNFLILTALKGSAEYEGSVSAARTDADCVRLEKQLPDARCLHAAITDLAIKVQDGTVSITDLRNNLPLEAYDFVQFRQVTMARDHFMAVALYLVQHQVPFVDALDVQGTAFGKISQMVSVAFHGLPVPDTLALWPTAGLRNEARTFVQPPFIMKVNDGIKGINNHLVNSWEQFDRLLEENRERSYVVQPFLPNDGDLRVLHMGATEPLIFSRQAAPGTHLNNTSQHGLSTRIDAANCDPNILELAMKAMRCFGREIGGVDILIDKTTNRPYILEVNDTPALFSGVFQEEKAAQYAAFLKAKIKE